MPTRTFPGRPVLHLLAVGAGLTLLYSCAAPGYHRAGGLFTPAPSQPPPVLDIVQVHELRGSATVQSGAQRQPLKAESEIHENQPVQVGSRSTLRLAIGQRALLDLGPNSRFVIHKLPRDGKGEERATWLRLEQGYLRVVWSDDVGDTPMEVSFGRWAARIGAGEHFFDSRGDKASACSTSGTMRLSGVPEWTPRSLSEPCVTLEPHHSPVEIALREKDWDTLRTKKRLQPTLARAATEQATQAVARLNKEGVRPVSWKPATSPGAFSADRLVTPPPSTVTTYSQHTPPVIQIPAQTPQDIAYAPPTPAVVDESRPASVRVIAPEDIPTVDTSDQQVVAAAAPTLKWTENLETDTSNLQPVAAPPAETASMDPASVPAATSSESAVQVTAFNTPPQEEDSTSAGVELAAPVASAPVAELPGSNGSEGGGAEWIVNVATYAAPDLAQQHAQQLIAQNFNATVRHETVRGRSSYRVVIEGLNTEAAAQSAVADLGTKYGVRSAWAMRKR